MVKINCISWEDYTYPTKEEFERAINSLPDFTNFEFETISDDYLIYLMENDPKNVISKRNLNSWDNVFYDKISNLKYAYIFCLFYHQREIAIHGEKCSIYNRNTFQFNFYVEAYFFFLISMRDISYQILNVFFDLEIDEKKIYYSSDQNVKNKNYNLCYKLGEIKRADINKLIADLNSKLATFSLIRNGFSHRYPKNISDSRFKIDEENKTATMSKDNRSTYDSTYFMKQIENSYLILSKYICDLKLLLK